MNQYKVIQFAQEKLLNDPYDNYHNLMHHYAVLENVHTIWQSDSLDINMDQLELAVWCHDLFKGEDDEENMLRELFTKFQVHDMEKILKIISDHSFGRTQTSNESKLIYDADKIDLVSITRWKYVFDLYKEGLVSSSERDKYVKEWNRRMPLLLNNLHFETSNRLFTVKFKSFVTWLKSINRINEGLFV